MSLYKDRDRCGKLWINAAPDFLEAGDGIAPGSLFVDPYTHPADESLGALGGPLERGVDFIDGMSLYKSWGAGGQK